MPRSLPQRVATVLACALGLAPTAVAQSVERTTSIELRRDLVTFAVTVRDRKGRCVPDLGAGTFEVYDDKIRQTIAFFSDDDMPVSLGIVFDLSGSMASKMPLAQRALGELLERSHRDDDVFAIGVSNGVKLLQDFTPNTPSVANAFMLTSTGGRTALIDAVFVAVTKCREGRNTRRAVVVISDGQDNWSRYTA